DRVLLQIMALARDVADHLEAVGEADLGDLAQRRVRLLRRRGVDAGAHAALLRALLQRRHLLLRMLRDARLADQLVDGRHRLACLACNFRSTPFAQARQGSIPMRKTEERLPLPVRRRSPVSQTTAPREARSGHALLI